MNNSEKIAELESLVKITERITEKYYSVLEKCDMMIYNYRDYMTTAPIDCNAELCRIETSDFETLCALLTMLLREDYFSNGSFERRIKAGQVKKIIDRIILLLNQTGNEPLKQFSEKALYALDGYYVYALIDPRNNEVFYIGKGTDNRIFDHEVESKKNIDSEKNKIIRIKEIINDGFETKKIILNWGLTEKEAFASEASLINMLNLLSKDTLTNIVSGHSVHEALSVENFEMIYGAECLLPEDIKESILVIKINKMYHRDMSSKELYDVVRGCWKVSLNSIRRKKVKYVLGVYNKFVVAVYKPDEWHYVHEMIDCPRTEEWDRETFVKLKDRVYFICKNYNELDEKGKFYLHKSISKLKVNQIAQNPITYLSPLNN